MPSTNSKKAVIITGGTRGLGAALVEHFVASGRTVVMNYRSEKAANTMLGKIESCRFPGRILPACADVRNRSDVQSMFALAKKESGGADILINSAGINRDKPFVDLSDEDWDEVVGTHLKGTFICSQVFAKNFTGESGVIINLGAACGVQGRLNGANFCSAKGGVHALTKCMAKELAPRIRVNCLLPSAVDTEEVRERYHLDTKKGLSRVLSGIPLKRLGAHTDVLTMVDSMISAEFTTGSTFYVNGGEFMN